jgi:uncharacterized protein
MRHFLDFVLRKLAAYPDDVDVRELPGDRLVTFQVTVHPEDVGRVIGRHGRTIGAIRGLLNAAGSRVTKRVVVEIHAAGSGTG